ncbi:MAG: endonuclease/exonuclease/phosphatase family protein [Planctomycetota bacterium]
MENRNSNNPSLRLVLAALLTAAPLAAADDRPAGVIRFAAFNAALSGETADDLPRRLATPDDEQLQKVAAIIQHVRPDVLLINEFDHDPTGRLAALFQTHYLGVAQADAPPITFAHTRSPPVNTGLPTGLDLDGDGRTDGPGDAHGWGAYPGQFGMLLLSRLDAPLELVASAQKTPWVNTRVSAFPESVLPAHARGIVRVSSKTHEAVRVAERSGRSLYVLISHPTPPVFDGPEDRNGWRNHAEIAMLVAMLRNVQRGLYPPFPPGPAVVLGDLNADPHDGESRPLAIDQLRLDPRIRDPLPASRGAVAKARADGGVNAEHRGDPALDTADWPDEPGRGPGNLRVDYVLPTADWTVVDAGVFWPEPGQAGHAWIDASDHRLVWADLALEAD